MITRHFIKTLIIFTVMIVLGLLGVFVVGYLDKANKDKELEACKTSGLC